MRLWWWLPLGLSKRQSTPTTVLLRTTLPTRTITQTTIEIMIDVTQKTEFWKLRKVMGLQVKNPGQTTTFQFLWMKIIFAEAVIGFYLCYPRRRNSNGTIFGSFLKYRKMAAVIEDSLLTTLFFPFGFINYDKFFQVLISLNGLLFFKKFLPCK